MEEQNKSSFRCDLRQIISEPARLTGHACWPCRPCGAPFGQDCVPPCGFPEHRFHQPRQTPVRFGGFRSCVPKNRCRQRNEVETAKLQYSASFRTVSPSARQFVNQHSTVTRFPRPTVTHLQEGGTGGEARAVTWKRNAARMIRTMPERAIMSCAPATRSESLRIRFVARHCW